MRKKIFLTVAVIGIVAIAAINVQLNFSKNTNSLILDNIEALGQGEANSCSWGSSSSCTTKWQETITTPTGLTTVNCSQTTTTCDGSGSICCTEGTTTSCSS